MTSPVRRSSAERAMWGVIKGILRPFRKPELPLYKVRDYLSPVEANRKIGRLLQSEAPFMVARFGSNELDITRRFRMMGVERLARLGITMKWNYWWTRGQEYYVGHNAGLFPISPKTLRGFCTLMIDSMKQVDVLGSWANGESYFARELASADLCELRYLEPWFHSEPWSQYLAGKTVLVIHPFADSVLSQYANHREELFEDPKVLPAFRLKTLRAVQSIAGNRPSGYADWFEALEDMFQQAIATDFDTAIVGCGAYGFPLAAKLKAYGKQAIHLGGSTQLFFGIRGGRWDNHPDISKHFNPHWIRPGATERPPGSESIEGGCYW